MISPEFQPVYLKDLRISIPEISIIRLAHQRHSPKSDRVTNHQHKHSQILLYLRGHGFQKTSRKQIEVHRGSLLYFPPNTEHGFGKSQKMSPLSLVVDFNEAKIMSKTVINRSVSLKLLSEIENAINRLVMNSDLKKEQSAQSAGMILQIFGLLYENLQSKEFNSQKIYPYTAKIRRLLSDQPRIVRFPREVAQLLKEDLSSINRKLRNESGMKLGNLIDEDRLNKCQQELQNSYTRISEIGWKCGFQDPNYFARWFRKKTGQTPSQWRAVNNLKVT
ncbi:MAG: AraC family transcriptional regulator [Verrucomicrobiota bacterium]|nr:AraC family transcriptional regulator [Verrucomicrobiota bacterium]